MNAEIIAVGSELLLGQIVNTNAKFLSISLAEMGVNVFHHTVVGDNPQRLKKSIEIAEQRADLIIFTGGLGPTKDDLTKETIANHLGRRLVTDEAALNSIEAYFLKVNRQMTENNKKQALVLEGATVLPNEFGMAPGMFIHNQNHYYMLLPGPPFEMEPMFTKYGRRAILAKMDKREHIESRVLRFFGIGEAQLETEIESIIEGQSNPTVAPYASDGECTLRITAKHQSSEEALRMIDETERIIQERVGEFCYGYNETTLMMETVKKLKRSGLTIACAESLTAGMFAAEMASISGVSNILKGGVVCYSSEAKEKLVKVKKETLDKYGAVSKECAAELAENIRTILDTDIGISFTGVAGPDSLEGKEAGTIWIGIAVKNQPVKTFLLSLASNRNSNRLRTVKYGCHYLMRELESTSNKS
ncbi:competence/damage-inducible protein A [Heyndrickxia camelliae]|uniref:Putative competence-damage inducible protein n=1 Tax=Heyndrickxia camelliae TaxID=1707093 RepID=A0A2N3LG96_9BACI|nr:competence/damage-inducible protein A [Heyndrickxia camelliae]PKR83587.1 competence/damage-inducible protein A [Heyndrickxia camelliae]